MKNNGTHFTISATGLPKCRTGIQGLDEITDGGLPRGRPTLVCGGAGGGKTLFAAEFLVRKLPPPVRKIIGDLSDPERVLVGLDLRPAD